MVLPSGKQNRKIDILLFTGLGVGGDLHCLGAILVITEFSYCGHYVVCH